MWLGPSPKVFIKLTGGSGTERSAIKWCTNQMAKLSQGVDRFFDGNL